ncbi:helix-turn-helix domain-containing protein [Dietzia cinnamea]|uniref:helix-turn-helix domain-containing protein n=1 Tax=Dietzia cinnamea TaxID=321318 RepID=UPI0021A8FB81|nr:helix-turn-helix domain-containing protein [Dietzia cinnamea]MCT1639735.1 helix-turn-helix domain-containing protein [Dietzia cinnamea]
MSTSSDAPLYLDQAAEYLSVSPKSIRRMVSRGDLPAYRLGGQGRLRFLKKDLDALLVPVPTVVRQGGGHA